MGVRANLCDERTVRAVSGLEKKDMACVIRKRLLQTGKAERALLNAETHCSRFSYYSKSPCNNVS